MMPEGRWLPGSLTPEYRADDPAPAGFPIGAAVVVIVSVVDPVSLRTNPRGTVSRRRGSDHWVRTQYGEHGPFVAAELIADDQADAKRQPPAWSLGIDTEQAVILCSCGQWWQGDPEDAAVAGPGSCRRPGHLIISVITTWEEQA